MDEVDSSLPPSQLRALDQSAVRTVLEFLTFTQADNEGLQCLF